MIPPLFLLKHLDIVLDFFRRAIVFEQCIFVIGLRTLVTNMIDPYGADLENLSVIHYVDGTLEICSPIMKLKQSLGEIQVA